MPAKKKAPNQRLKSGKPSAEKRSGTTTVDSAPKRGGSSTTKPTSIAPKLPLEKTPAKSPVKVVYPPRERRVSPEGRRGRFAEKLPPGTRTKMLKIIYDRKAEMARKKQQAMIGKVILCILLVASIYFGAQHLIEFTTRSLSSAVEMLDLSGWWNNVAVEERKQIRTIQRQTPQERRNPTRIGHRSRIPVQKYSNQQVRQSSQSTTKAGNQKYYGQTSVYRKR